MGPNVQGLLQLIRAWPETRISVAADDASVLARLDAEAGSTRVSMKVFLDLDCGQHRTGVKPGAHALDLYRQIHQANNLEAGGLHILGTERHESRRIDNQLRGRAGRQGDPGSSRFYLSLEDNLMRIFASDRVKNFMQALGMEKGEAIEHRMVTNAIEKAQRKVEGRNFDIRKQLLEYDDVANDQRQVIYQQRNELLT